MRSRGGRANRAVRTMPLWSVSGRNADAENGNVSLSDSVVDGATVMASLVSVFNASFILAWMGLTTVTG